jgi:hypothetical protein
MYIKRTDAIYSKDYIKNDGWNNGSINILRNKNKYDKKLETDILSFHNINSAFHHECL